LINLKKDKKNRFFLKTFFFFQFFFEKKEIFFKDGRGRFCGAGPRGVVVRSRLQVALPHSVESESNEKALPASHAIAFGDRPGSGAVGAAKCRAGALKDSACLSVKVQLQLISQKEDTETTPNEDGVTSSSAEWTIANQLLGCVESDV
jgi:hypothetical protein